MRPVKFALPLVALFALSLCACNTIENRRSLYSPAKGDGPYTRSLEDGSWEHPKSVDEQYSDAARKRRQMKTAPLPAKAPAPAAGVQPEPAL
jgi:hypothetical protein